MRDGKEPVNTRSRSSNAEVASYSLVESEAGEDAVLVAKPKRRRPFETRAILTLAILSLVLLPFFYGGKSIIAEYVFVVSVLSLGAVLSIRRILLGSSETSTDPESSPRVRASFSARESLLGGIMMSFVCLALFQTLEFPLPVLEAFSTNAAEAYRLSGASSGAISLDTEQTKSAALTVLSVLLLCLGLVALPPESVSTRAKRSSARRSRRGSSTRFSSTHRERVVHLLQTMIVITGVLLSTVAVAHWTLQSEKLFGVFAPARTLFSGNTPHWPFVNPDHLAIFLEIAIVLAASLFFRSLYVSREEARRGAAEARTSLLTFFLQPEKFGRVVYLGGGVMFMLLCSLLTLSRAANSLAIFGIALLSISYLWLLPKPIPLRSKSSPKSASEKNGIFSQVWRRRLGLGLFFFFGFGAVVSFLVGESARHALYERVDYGLTVKYEHLRAELSRASWELFEANPLLGVGLGNWHLAAGEFGSEEFAGFRLDYAHNEPLQLAAETGFLGMSLVLVGLGVLAYWTLRAWRYQLPAVVRLDLLGTSLAISLPILHSLVDFPLHMPALAVVMAVCLALHLRMLHWIELSKSSFPLARSSRSREREMIRNAMVPAQGEG